MLYIWNTKNSLPHRPGEVFGHDFSQHGHFALRAHGISDAFVSWGSICCRIMKKNNFVNLLNILCF